MWRLKRHIALLPYYIEAFFQLSLCKLAITLLPFKIYSKQYGTLHSETFYESLSHSINKIQAISTVLRVLPRFLPWKSKCLDQAMAASKMLQKRQIPYTLYFGMTQKNQSKIAHAWLRAGKHWVVGYQPHISYAILGVYAWVN